LFTAAVLWRLGTGKGKQEGKDERRDEFFQVLSCVKAKFLYIWK
jgi:hypothetical protein